MFERFSHYLSYGATDQQTARDLTKSYDGLLVPGTVAAFQADGTRGFVLTLSAASRNTPYVIDPRFPLFQQRLENPKKSHISLASCLGDARLVRNDTSPRPDDFTPERIDQLALNWLQFNSGYRNVSSKHFAKYAERLGEAVIPENTSNPANVLPPYTVARGVDDPWWQVSTSLWRSSVRQAASMSVAPLVQVVAAENAAALESLLASASGSEVAIWASRLDELDATPSGLAALTSYGRAIQASSQRLALFALYGGFFSVLMARYGLLGSSHGIGYGEWRDWVELPQSGPPPARYYLPRVHRYVSQDLALLFWRTDPDLVVCHCAECLGQNPARLDYQALMRHSVRCRQSEIEAWNTKPTIEAADRLDSDSAAFETSVATMDIPPRLRQQAVRCHVHLRGWASVLRDLDEA